MKTYKYKLLSILVVLSVSVQAQKHDKVIKESFKVNHDVTVVVNSSHADVTIETWNKNTVSIEAVMEIEGLDKKEADKILAQWNFEALGNKNKVNITSDDNFFFEFNHDFDMDFDFDFPEIDIDIPEIHMPDIDIDIPEIDIVIPELEFPDIEIPEIEMDIEEFDYQAYKKDSTYLKKYKLKIAKQVEKFKNSDWKKKMDSFKNSEEYKKQIEEIKLQSKKFAKQLKESGWHKKMTEYRNSEEFKHAMEESKKVAEDMRKQMLENKELWIEQAERAKEAGKQAREIIEKMKEDRTFDSLKKNRNNVYYKFLNDKNAKVKIRKYIKIKVPKKATFDLNVRHGKLNVPNSSTKMSAVISYGDFIAGIIEGERNELKISNSPVVISSVSSGNITLKNVPNAMFGTFSNANLFANSSNVVIEKVGEDVALSQKFGELEVLEIIPDFKTFNVILDYAKGSLDLSDAAYNFQLNGKKSNIYVNEVLTESSNRGISEVDTVQGFSKDKNSANKLFLTGVYSTARLN